MRNGAEVEMGKRAKIRAKPQTNRMTYFDCKGYGK